MFQTGSTDLNSPVTLRRQSTAHDNYYHNRIVRERGSQVMRKMWRLRQPENTTSSEYSITRGSGNRRGRRKTRVVSPVMGQAGCPGREPHCLKLAGTWMGVSARMYNDSNSLGDRAKEGRGSEHRHVGTGEGISDRKPCHTQGATYRMWQIHMKTGLRRVEEAIASTAQTCCGRGMKPACRWGPA